MIWSFDGRDYEIDVFPLKKAKKVTIRKKSAYHYAIRTPKHVPVDSLKTLFFHQLSLFEDLPVPLDYDAYLNQDEIMLWGELTDQFKGLSLAGKKEKLDAIILEELSFIELYFKKTQSYIDLDDLTYQVKTYESKFGSCHPQRRIIRFNRMLAHYPKPYLEYIYAHEIVHLNIPHHQQAFYDLLSLIEPKHAQLKKELHQLHQSFTRS